MYAPQIFKTLYLVQNNRVCTFLFYFILISLNSRRTSSLPSCLWSQMIFPSLPGSRLYNFLSRCKFSTLTTRHPMVEFYLNTFPRFPLRKKEHKSYFGKNRTRDFRTTSRCAGYLLDHSSDEYYYSVFIPVPLSTSIQVAKTNTTSYRKHDFDHRHRLDADLY